MNKKLVLVLSSLAMLKCVLPVTQMRSTVNPSGRSMLSSDLRVGQISQKKLPMGNSSYVDPSPDIPTIYVSSGPETRAPRFRSPKLPEPIDQFHSWTSPVPPVQEMQLYKASQPTKFTDVKPISSKKAKKFKTSSVLDEAKAAYDRTQAAQGAEDAMNAKLKQEARDRQVAEQILIGQKKDAETYSIQQRNRINNIKLQRMAIERAVADGQAKIQLNVDQNAQRTQIEDSRKAELDQMFADFKIGLSQAPEKTDEQIKFEQAQALSSRLSDEQKSRMNFTPSSDFLESQIQKQNSENLTIPVRPAQLAPLNAQSSPTLPSPMGRKLVPLTRRTNFDLAEAAKKIKTDKKAIRDLEAPAAAAKAEKNAQFQLN